MDFASSTVRPYQDGCTIPIKAPADAARSATEAGVRELVFYHTIPPLPSHLLNALFVRDAKKAFDGKITVSEDGMVFSLPVDSDTITQHDGFR